MSDLQKIRIPKIPENERVDLKIYRGQTVDFGNCIIVTLTKQTVCGVAIPKGEKLRIFDFKNGRGDRFFRSPCGHTVSVTADAINPTLRRLFLDELKKKGVPQ